MKANQKLSPSDSEDGNELDNYLISPNDNPLPLLPNRGQLDPASNWLQSSSESNTDLDQDQFLLNADDMYSDADFSSCSDPDVQGNDSLDDFEITDHYVDDEPLESRPLLLRPPRSKLN